MDLIPCKWIDILTRMEHCTSMYNVIRCMCEWKAENQVERKPTTYILTAPQFYSHK